MTTGQPGPTHTWVEEAEELIDRAARGGQPTQAVYDRLRQIEYRVLGRSSDDLVERLLRAVEAVREADRPRKGGLYRPIGPEPPRRVPQGTLLPSPLSPTAAASPTLLRAAAEQVMHGPPVPRVTLSPEIIAVLERELNRSLIRGVLNRWALEELMKDARFMRALPRMSAVALQRALNTMILRGFTQRLAAGVGRALRGIAGRLVIEEIGLNAFNTLGQLEMIYQSGQAAIRDMNWAEERESFRLSNPFRYRRTSQIDLIHAPARYSLFGNPLPPQAALGIYATTPYPGELSSEQQRILEAIEHLWPGRREQLMDLVANPELARAAGIFETLAAADQLRQRAAEASIEPSPTAVPDELPQSHFDALDALELEVERILQQRALQGTRWAQSTGLQRQSAVDAVTRQRELMQAANALTWQELGYGGTPPVDHSHRTFWEFRGEDRRILEKAKHVLAAMRRHDAASTDPFIDQADEPLSSAFNIIETQIDICLALERTTVS